MGSRVERLADLIVNFGANVQEGQILDVGSGLGKEELTRAITASAYKRGAKFVDVHYWDPHLKRERVLYAPDDVLEFVPPWYGQRILALSEGRAARIMLSGPVAPDVMEGVDPALASRDMLPALRESIEVVNQRTTNWVIGPCPTPGWAGLVHPGLDPGAADLVTLETAPFEHPSGGQLPFRVLPDAAERPHPGRLRLATPALHLPDRARDPAVRREGAQRRGRRTPGADRAWNQCLRPGPAARP